MLMHPTYAQIASEALRYAQSFGRPVHSVRVWFVGDRWSEARDDSCPSGGHLEVLFPYRDLDLPFEGITAELRPRIEAALRRNHATV